MKNKYCKSKSPIIEVEKQTFNKNVKKINNMSFSLNSTKKLLRSSSKNNKNLRNKSNNKSCDKKNNQDFESNDLTYSNNNPESWFEKNNKSQDLANELLFNVNDDYNTLIYKNSKLRELIIKANETIIKSVIIFFIIRKNLSMS